MPFLVYVRLLVYERTFSNVFVRQLAYLLANDT